MVQFIFFVLQFFRKGRQDEVDDTTVTALEVLPEPYKSMAQTLLEVCGYAGMKIITCASPQLFHSFDVCLLIYAGTLTYICLF